jgi:hypothetical protein
MLAYGPYECVRLSKGGALKNADSFAWFALEYYWSTRCGTEFKDYLEPDNISPDPDVPLE